MKKVKEKKKKVAKMIKESEARDVERDEKMMVGAVKRKKK
jgi:hypothetical protein